MPGVKLAEPLRVDGRRERDAPAGTRRSPVPVWLAVGMAAVVAVSVALRFWTTSDLWLDEALTVNVAGSPLHQITGLLRTDGSPPLYYFLLHFWMEAFGRGDLAVRSLSGAFGVISLPLAWLVGRRFGERSVAWVTMLVVATSPFAVRYSTEGRMYSLVLALALAGAVALTSALRRPRPANLIAVAVITGLLLYSHYWSFYLLAVVALTLAWMALKGSRPARLSLVALVVGCLTFVPWLPTLAFQLRHTGTPWAAPASYSAMVHAVGEWAGGDASPARALGLAFFALTGLALFGAAVDGRHIELDLRTRPRARYLTVVTFATLAVAITVGLASRSAFQDRYTAVVFGFFAVLVAMGVTTFSDRWVRYGAVALIVVLGLAVSASNVTTNRTQAGQVAAAIRAEAHPGDVVGYCPDQLGPDVSRLLPNQLDQVTFPRDRGPRIVDWADYAKATGAASPAAFAALLNARAGSGHTVYLVWAPGYLTYGNKCQDIVTSLQALRPSDELVHYSPKRFYEFEDLIRFPPR